MKSFQRSYQATLQGQLRRALSPAKAFFSPHTRVVAPTAIIIKEKGVEIVPYQPLIRLPVDLRAIPNSSTRNERFCTHEMHPRIYNWHTRVFVIYENMSHGTPTYRYTVMAYNRMSNNRRVYIR